MKFRRSVVSVLLTAAMLMGCLFIPAFSASAAADAAGNTGAADSSQQVAAGNSTAYNLPSNIQDGNIFQAFTWRFTDIAKYMKEIAEQGFGAVQVSPVQPTAFKADSDNAASYMIDWWKYYQPVDFTLGNGLGTKADFKEMCKVAKSYGVKVIVDIVSNHMAQSDTGASFSKSKQIPADLRTDASAWHAVKNTVTDNSRSDMTQKSLGGLPDLNTASTKVQNYVKGLLKDCLDNGADGFRFDAAKHIELPSDNPSSDFWPNITGYIKGIKPDAYIYGEVLNPCKTNDYTKYIKMTDSAMGANVRNAVKSGSPNSGIINYSAEGASAKDIVTWVESHDNFCDGTSTSLTHQQLLLGWGIIGARKDSAALYFCRPEHEALENKGFIKYDELIGGPGNTLWQDKTVAEVNKFRNNFTGQSETVKTSGSQFYVQRGTTGMVIVNLGGSNASINYASSMANGTYKDQVNGGTFTVSGGKLTGSVPAKSVAVIYNKTKTTPVANVFLNGNKVTSDTTTYTGNTTGYFKNNYNFTSDTATLALSLADATSGTYSISGGKAVAFSGTTSVQIGKNVNSNTSITVKVTATDGTRTTEETYVFVKKLPSEKLTVYFDSTGYETWAENYVFVKNANGSAVKAYPGFEMTKVSADSKIYKAELTGVTGSAYIKFNEGNVPTGLDGRTVPATVVNFGSAAVPANREKGGFLLNGSMIWQNGEWKDYGYSTDETPVEPTIPTETDPDTKPTETDPIKPTETDPVKPGEKYMLGDADMNGAVRVADVLKIQQHLASMLSLQGNAYLAADVNANGKLETADALEIQKFLAGMGSKYKIGEYIGGGETPTVKPTDPDTKPTETNPTIPTIPSLPTDPVEPDDTVTVTLNKPANWSDDVYAYVFNAAGGNNAEWPGEPMQVSGATCTITVPSGMYDSIIFADGPAVVPDGKEGTKQVVRMQSATMSLYSGTYDIPMTTVSVPSNLGFTPTHLYCFNPDENSFAETYAWPGLELTGASMEIPAGVYTTAIFNDNGTNQEQISIEGSDPGPTDPINPTDPVDPNPEGTITIYFSNGVNWSNVYLYAWRTSDENKNHEWPGVELISIGKNSFGEQIFSATIDISEYDKIIFNNGNGQQTQDIDLAGMEDSTGFYCDKSSQDAQGHYAYGSYHFDPSYIV